MIFQGLKNLLVSMNHIIDGTKPNCLLPAMIIDKDYMCRQVKDDAKA